MTKNVCFLLKTFIITATFIGTYVPVVHSQNNQNINFKYCTAHPIDNCFNPIDGAVDTVGRDVFSLGGEYRICLPIEEVTGGISPIRVVLVLDRSYSMCGISGACCVDGDGSDSCMMNDPDDKRIEASIQFVNNLASKSPLSEVGVVVYDRQADSYEPLVLNSQSNIDLINERISSAACASSNFIIGGRLNQEEQVSGLNKTTVIKGTKATFLGLGLSEGLATIDESYNPDLARHVILLTDGAWDDPPTSGRSPGELIAAYKSEFPDRPVPTIHGVFLSNTELHLRHDYPAEGCSNTDNIFLDSLKAATTLGGTTGQFFGGSTPQTVVANFDSLLKSVSVFEAQRLSGLVVTNTTNNTTRNHTAIKTVESTAEQEAHYEATIDDLPIEFGINSLTFQQTIQKPGVTEPEIITSNVTIYRTTEWTTRINEAEYSLYCENDSTTISISVTPPLQMINNPFDVTATIALKEKLIVDTTVMRIFTENPDVNDNSTIALFHCEGDLTNSIGSATGTGDVTTSTESALFGNYGIVGGSFSYPVGTLNGDFAFECWIKPSSVVQKTEIFNSSSISLAITEDRYLTLSAAGNVLTESAQHIDVGVWSHIAVARASGYLYLFINGSNVSEPVTFADNITGVVTVTVPANCALDEVKASSINRIVSARDGSLRFVIASLSNPTWTIGGTPVGQAEITIPPMAWNSGILKLAFSSPVPGKFVVNLSHLGTSLKTLWSKNGNPVTVSADQQGPYVENSIFTRGNFGTEYDTLHIFFTEPVSCDSLKKGAPAASFEVYDSLKAVKPDIFAGAEYLDLSCPESFITETRMIVKTMMNGIIPRKDSIKLMGIVVDTAGNFPDTLKRGPINFGPGSGLDLYAMENDRDQGKPPMTIYDPDADRLGIPPERRRGKLFVLTTKEVLTTWGTTHDGTPNYAQKTVIFDAVGNVVAIDVPLQKSADDERMYFVVWDGMNKNYRRVSTGAYLFRAYVKYINDEVGKIVSKQVKFLVDWGRKNKF